MSIDSEVFTFPGDRPRRLTRNSTKETRENWFKAFDASELDRLRRALPKVPPEPVLPDPRKVAVLAFPLLALLVILELILATGLTIFQPWLVLSHLLVCVTLFFFANKKSASENPPSSFLKNRIGLSAIAVLLVTVSYFFYIQFFEGDIWIAAIADALAVGILGRWGVYPWIAERSEVKKFNAAHDYLTQQYERNLQIRRKALATAEQINSQINSLYIDCLHYEEMIKIRRELFDSLLKEAFAELGVSEEIQHQIVADRDRNILEITGFLAIPNSIYERQVVEFRAGVLPRLREDAPALADCLSHLYTYRVAIILPQGLGTYDAIVDTVDLTYRSLGNQLTMWKSISRVNRENSAEGWAEDMIVLETYGGTKTDLKINGIRIKENVELIPVVDVGASETSSDPINGVGPVQGRVVNSFVLAIQQKMTE
jgi:hypothetical protein